MPVAVVGCFQNEMGLSRVLGPGSVAKVSLSLSGASVLRAGFHGLRTLAPSIRCHLIPTSLIVCAITSPRAPHSTNIAEVGSTCITSAKRRKCFQAKEWTLKLTGQDGKKPLPLPAETGQEYLQQPVDPCLLLSAAKSIRGTSPCLLYC